MVNEQSKKYSDVGTKRTATIMLTRNVCNRISRCRLPLRLLNKESLAMLIRIIVIGNVKYREDNVNDNIDLEVEVRCVRS